MPHAMISGNASKICYQDVLTILEQQPLVRRGGTIPLSSRYTVA